MGSKKESVNELKDTANCILILELNLEMLPNETSVKKERSTGQCSLAK